MSICCTSVSDPITVTLCALFFSRPVDRKLGYSPTPVRNQMGNTCVSIFNGVRCSDTQVSDQSGVTMITVHSMISANTNLATNPVLVDAPTEHIAAAIITEQSAWIHENGYSVILW